MNFASLQHSVFLHALGNAILNSLWEGFVLWLIYETVTIFYKNASSKFKNNFSTVLLFFSFLWFFIGFISSFFNQENADATSLLSASSTVTPVIQGVSGLERFITYALSTLPYLSVAYIFLLFFLMIKLFTAYRYVYIISNKRLKNIPSELHFFASNVAKEMGITKKISVWISQHIDVPATIGFIKPVILIPVASFANLSAHQLEAIILHELSHIKRNDYLINLFISVIETILFFNPFTALLSNAIKRERENCCDDFVLQYQYDPHAYASALLRLEQSRAGNLKLAIGAISGKKQLLLRIKRITNSQTSSKQFNYGQKLLAFVLVTGIICCVGWLSPKQKNSSEITIARKQQNSAKTSIIAKNTNPSSSKAIIKAESSHEKTLKQITARNDGPIFPNLSSTDIVRKEFFDSEDQKTSDTDDLLEERKDEIVERNNSKEPFFSFKEDDIKLPKSINIKNFPFQKMDFNIDLTDIDTKQLNENLKKAYKEINSLNWNKIQDDINKTEQQAKFLAQQKQALSQLENAQEEFKRNSVISHVDKAIRDSLVSSEVFIPDNDALKMRQKLSEIQQKYSNTLKKSFSFHYDINGQPKIINKKFGSKNSFSYDENAHKKIKITINHIPQLNGILNNRKLLQLSFNSSEEESAPGDRSINIEIDNK